MKTAKQLIWDQYYAAVRSGQKKVAESLLKQLHQQPATPKQGCRKCRKRF